MTPPSSARSIDSASLCRNEFIRPVSGELMAVDLKAEEITEIIRQQLTGIGRGVDVAEVGTVTSVGDGIARVYGLERVMAGQLVPVPHNIAGLPLNLRQDNVGCVRLGEASPVKAGDQVKRSGT